MGVGQSAMTSNTLCRYCIQVHPFLARKAAGLPFLAIAQTKTIRTLSLFSDSQYTCFSAQVVVVDSHIQRIALATEENTVSQQVSYRPIKYQSRLCSQRGTKVNGSHHGDNPLLRPTGIQIATQSHATLQAMAPTNVQTVQQTS